MNWDVFGLQKQILVVASRGISPKPAQTAGRKRDQNSEKVFFDLRPILCVTEMSGRQTLREGSRQTVGEDEPETSVQLLPYISNSFPLSSCR